MIAQGDGRSLNLIRSPGWEDHTCLHISERLFSA